jgi:histidinol-phosphate aminotransferase
MRAAPRSWVGNLAEYVPGRHVDRGPGNLASNEPPIYGWPSVSRAISDSLEEIHRYPDPLADRLRGAVAADLGLDPNQVLVGNGSDELIFLLCLAYAAGGGRVVVARPPYRIHALAPAMVGAELEEVPLRQWRHDLDAMADVEADLAFVCNPHNPTGSAVSRAALERFVERARAGLVVVDEAYVDFATDPAELSALPLAREGRCVVLRTMSKLYGIAGLRVGLLLGAEDVISVLRKARMPFSVGTLAQAGALAAWEDRSSAEAVRSYVIGAREELAGLLEEAGLGFLPSEANFVLAFSSDEDRLVEWLWERGISVRPGSQLGVPGSVRITVPSPEGMRLLRSALRELPSSLRGHPPDDH